MIKFAIEIKVFAMYQLIDCVVSTDELHKLQLVEPETLMCRTISRRRFSIRVAEVGTLTETDTPHEAGAETIRASGANKLHKLQMKMCFTSKRSDT